MRGGSTLRFLHVEKKFDIAFVRTLLSAAAIITLVGFVEGIIMAKQYADRHGYVVSANRELVAFGAANVFASFFGSWPAYASMPRTVVRTAARWARGSAHPLILGGNSATTFSMEHVLPGIRSRTAQVHALSSLAFLQAWSS